MKRILVQDSNEDILDVVKIALEKAGYQTFLLKDHERAASVVQEFQPDLLIMEFRRSNNDRMESFKKIHSCFPNLPVIAFSTAELPEAFFLRQGFAGLLPKPFDLRQLYNSIQKAMDTIVSS